MLRASIILLFLLWLTPTQLAAAECDEVGCVAEQTFYMSWALGYGQRSNPLHGGNTLPLALLPEIYYYGERWFFDNGRIGSALYIRDNWQLSINGQFNHEKGYFKNWFGGNVFQLDNAPLLLPDLTTSAEVIGPLPLSINEVNKRPTAFDIGLQLDWFNKRWQWQWAIWQDASGKHHGQYVTVGVARLWHTPVGAWQLGSRVHWKSANLIDTYYGISADEAGNGLPYQGQSSVQPELRLNWTLPLSDKLSVIAFGRYLHLDDAMTDSPLVKSDYIVTWFAGISYRFY
ncbi:MipA/OmpV family protein [Arsukibacterium sp.]|uniref:MipA/OmpV family protein n=1 Tax=Arsukibacterium sp. TaxID=1977258 RepID=UPI002FDB78AD